MKKHDDGIHNLKDSNIHYLESNYTYRKNIQMMGYCMTYVGQVKKKNGKMDSKNL